MAVQGCRPLLAISQGLANLGVQAAEEITLHGQGGGVEFDVKARQFGAQQRVVEIGQQGLVDRRRLVVPVHQP